MKIVNLPEDIYSSKGDKNASIIFHDYTVQVGTFKGWSILNKNAISLVVSGEKTMLFADRSLSIKDDEFHFLSAGNCLASVQLSEKKVFRSFLIFYDTQLLTDFYVKYNSRISQINEKQQIERTPYVSFKKDDFVLNYIKSLQLLVTSTNEVTTEMKMLKFEELLLHLLETNPQKLLSFQSMRSRDFDDVEIRKAVETNIANNLTLEELAFLCNMSLSTFKRRFMEIYGSSPNKWILQKRMQRAKELLLHYNQKPGEVYYQVGYENHSSFSQSFKKIYGMTPREFQLQRVAG